MPVYEFICESCGAEEEFTQSMADPLPTTCPNCGESEAERFHQVYSGENFTIVKGEPTTFGAQAELNAKRVGKEQMQRMVEEAKNSREKAKELPKGASRLKDKYKAAKPWWRDTEKPLDVSKIKDKKKFILTGEKN